MMEEHKKMRQKNLPIKLPQKVNISAEEPKKEKKVEVSQFLLKNLNLSKRRHKKFYITCKSKNVNKKKLTGDLHCKVVFYGKDKKKEKLTE